MPSHGEDSSVLMFTPVFPPLSSNQMPEVQLGQESLAESAHSSDLFHYCLFGDLQQSSVPGVWLHKLFSTDSRVL